MIFLYIKPSWKKCSSFIRTCKAHLNTWWFLPKVGAEKMWIGIWTTSPLFTPVHGLEIVFVAKMCTPCHPPWIFPTRLRSTRILLASCHFESGMKHTNSRLVEVQQVMVILEACIRCAIGVYVYLFNMACIMPCHCHRQKQHAAHLTIGNFRAWWCLTKFEALIGAMLDKSEQPNDQLDLFQLLVPRHTKQMRCKRAI